jgi:hypothetical protein
MESPICLSPYPLREEQRLELPVSPKLLERRGIVIPSNMQSILTRLSTIDKQFDA